MSGDLIDAVRELGVDGLVIEALWCRESPPKQFPVIKCFRKWQPASCICITCF